MTTQPKIRISSKFEFELRKINDQTFVLVVDDFLLNPEEVAAYAGASASEFFMP
jgi:hypothetical protein